MIFRLAAAGLLIATALTTPAPAEDDVVRPKIDFMNRWREDWSVLADPRLRTEPLARSAPDPSRARRRGARLVGDRTARGEGRGPLTRHRRRHGSAELGLRLVIAYKLVKACGELALAALLGGVVLNGAADRVGALDAALRAHMTAAWSLRLTDLLARAATARNVALTAGALVLDGALTLCEGWVLYRGLTWGPWLVVITTGSLLPFEVVELARRPRAGRFVILVVNLAIVWYLAARAARRRRTRRPDAIT